MSLALRRWAELFGVADIPHRKYWEWCFIAEALREQGVLLEGKRGLGFGVGEEPLTSCFARYGASVVATDLEPAEAVRSGWAIGPQHAANKEALNRRGLCPPERFDQLVSFEFCDMRLIPEGYRDFDFLWSSCALEHLGSQEAGEQFIFDALRCLRRGGIAVHTTEFNISSLDETIDSGPVVLFTRGRIERLMARLRDQGCFIEMDWRYGGAPLDYYVDVPPYRLSPHLKLRIGEYTATSLGLVIVKL
jgi:hypothetical protein